MWRRPRSASRPTAGSRHLDDGATDGVAIDHARPRPARYADARPAVRTQPQRSPASATVGVPPPRGRRATTRATGSSSRPTMARTAFEVVGGVERPALVAEHGRPSTGGRAEAVGPAVHERRHVLALGRIVGLVRPPSRSAVGADDFDVEAVGERAHERVRRVVGVGSRWRSTTAAATIAGSASGQSAVRRTTMSAG